MPKSWKPEVRTGSDPKYYGNALRFPTAGEAARCAIDLMSRWMAVNNWQVVESDDAPNYRWANGALMGIDPIDDMVVPVEPEPVETDGVHVEEGKP